MSTAHPTYDDVWQMFQETARRFQETDRKFQETDLRFKETDRKLRELSELFTGQWGKLVEALVRPGLLNLFRQRGIQVNETLQRDLAQRDGREMEIDVMLINGDVVIPVEVKTTLKVADVNDFLQRMQEFLLFFPKYRGYRIYGAVAGVQIEERADRYAYRKGLFVLTLGRDGLSRILNDEKFIPKDLAATAGQ
ncbi:MAG: hypothetical protein EPN21_02415 [Methylococcaceae bacterium]|nr:MAG: hypothetical protein EPN21_02415 [Methylococcaceae bacterium]